MLAEASLKVLGSVLGQGTQPAGPAADEEAQRVLLEPIKELDQHQASPSPEPPRSSGVSLPSVPTIEVTVDPAKHDAAIASGFAVNAEEVFRVARDRAQLVFRVNLALSIGLSIILIGGLVAAIVLAVMGKGGLAAIFGGVAIADIAAAAVYNPLKQINESMLVTQRMDMIQLSAQQQLDEARQIQDLDKRRKAMKSVWDGMKAELADLSAKPA